MSGFAQATPTAPSPAEILHGKENILKRLGRKVAHYAFDPAPFAPTFKMGTLSRGYRDILAERLKRVKSITDPFGLATYMIQQGYFPQPPFTKSERRRKLTGRKRDFDPDKGKTVDNLTLSKLLEGELKAGDHAYVGRPVMDLGKGHAHAIIDIPWHGLQVKYDPSRPFDTALHPEEGLLRLVEKPLPSGKHELMEVQITVPADVFDFLASKFAAYFTNVGKSRLIRRGSDPRPTGVFIDRG